MARKSKNKEKKIPGRKVYGEKRSLLKNVSLFSELRQDELDMICSNSEFLSFKDDEVIFRSRTER